MVPVNQTGWSDGKIGVPLPSQPSDFGPKCQLDSSSKQNVPEVILLDDDGGSVKALE